MRALFELKVRHMISQEFSLFQDFIHSSLYCVQTSSFLFVGMWRVCKSSKIKHQEVQGALSSRPTGDPGQLFLYFCQITPLKSVSETVHPCTGTVDNSLHM